MREKAKAGDVVAGRYVLLERIGAGGMGVVWRARDRRLHRTVALKCARLDDERAVERLKAEARNAASLHHPHIVAVFDHVEDDEGCWLVMEYVASRSLSEIVAADGPLPPERAAAIGWQIADALEAAHAQGVVHGDVTPENILVTAEGIAKLADFGISRALWTDATQQNLTGGVQGKPRYIAPEVAKGAPVSRESDRFSLGASLFAAVEGRSPYGEAAHPMAFIGRAMAGHIEKPVRAGQLVEPLAQLLRQDPGSRPLAATARQLLGAIAPPSEAVRRLHAEDAGPYGYGSPYGDGGLYGDGSGEAGGGDGGGSGGAGGRLVPVAVPEPGRGPLTWWLGAGAVAVVTALVVALLVTRPWSDGSSSDGSGAEAKGGGPATGRPAASASASPSASPRAPQASSLGDARTADPCSLLTAASLSRFGHAELTSTYGNFDRCDVLVDGKDTDTSAEVAATFVGGDVEAGTQVRTRKAGDVTIAEETEADGECDRTLRLGDGGHVQIMARMTGDTTPADLCMMADAATDQALVVLAGGEVPRRPSPAEPDSLATADACELLTPAALAAAPGTDAAHPQADFADWGCHWGNTADASGDSGVDLVFDRNSPALDASDGHPVRLGPKQGYLAAGYEDSGSCTARIVNRTFTDIKGDVTQELVELTVAGPGTADALCETARKLGAAAAPRLPKV